MKLMLSYVLSATAFLLLGACASSSKISGVQVGMSKKEVVAAMGEPDTVSAQGSSEYLSYYLCYSNCAALIVENRGRDWYYVRLINGQVESFGRKGDFDSTKTPTTRVERVETIKQDIRSQQAGDKYSELAKLKSLLDSGAITKAEFEEQKKKLLAK
jgi:hypothetical protein